MKAISSCIILLITTSFLYAQSTQVIRGQVIDEVSQTSLPGVTLLMEGNTSLGTTTDENGYYRISNVPLGRQTVKISYIGYAEQLLSNIVVTAGKEVVLIFR